jgi:hypothetical protein
MIILLVLFYYIKIPISNSDPDHRIENIIDAIFQIKNNHFILVGIIG